uniref:Metallophosphoesterase 1 n=1 Tax=Salmo trutta TaxID=8032 RepID=A0A674D7N9_SALTR
MHGHFTLFLSVICVFILCEYLIYHPAILHCSWSELNGNREFLLLVLLSGLSTWSIKLPALIIVYCTLLPDRAWQMERAFRTALGLSYSQRWSSFWETSLTEGKRSSSKVSNAIIGNHNIGFHHGMNWHKLEHFERVFNVTSARIVTTKGHVENELYSLSQALNCSVQVIFITLIILHYPMYHLNDVECTGQDIASLEERHQVFHEHYDMLYQEASQRLLCYFPPCLILSGHTHSACKVVHDNKHPEISVPSFSWRNRNNPSFILGTFSPTDFQLAKCFLLEESSMVAIYCATAMVVSLMLIAHLHFSKELHAPSHQPHGQAQGPVTVIVSVSPRSNIYYFLGRPHKNRPLKQHSG